jgi:hypothetical protein
METVRARSRPSYVARSFVVLIDDNCFNTNGVELSGCAGNRGDALAAAPAYRLRDTIPLLGSTSLFLVPTLGQSIAESAVDRAKREIYNKRLAHFHSTPTRNVNGARAPGGIISHDNTVEKGPAISRRGPLGGC